MKHWKQPITSIEYGSLQAAYDHFNKTLFKGMLPNVLITMQRRSRSYGYFLHDGFADRQNKAGSAHEVALNPDGFSEHSDEEIMSTLVHEMVHVWQHVFGNPGSGRYHNREWAAKMKELGLHPSDTGAPGGQETGSRVSHYIIPAGAFQVAYRALQETGWLLRWQSGDGAFTGTGALTAIRSNQSKTKFSCPECGQNVWGKPDTNVLCGDCKMQMAADVQP
jgi:predicted RNA-binding Zn-ribbon protein involved in translation (DUF1610 family)